MIFKWLRKYFRKDPAIIFKDIPSNISITISTIGGGGWGGSSNIITKDDTMKPCKDCKEGKCKKHKK